MLKTEMRNEKSMHIDKMSTLEMCQLMNEENMNSVKAVEEVLPEIAKAIDVITRRMEQGGKLIYIGAGTSGRLGILDASECPPTFGVSDTLVQGIIAGGKERVFKAGENAEDSYENGMKDVETILNPHDILVGISAAGGAKYIIGALEKAKSLGCATIAISSNENTPITKIADISITPNTGPEVITGSTRLKAGNAQKFILNMLSTCAMVKTGKVYENLMINLKPSNDKLKNRVIRITSQILNCSEEAAILLLDRHDWNIKKTIENVK